MIVCMYVLAKEHGSDSARLCTGSILISSFTCYFLHFVISHLLGCIYFLMQDGRHGERLGLTL